MKKILVFVFAVLLSAPALADNVTIIRDEDSQVRDLPGNAQIVTGDRDTVVIQGDDDVWRTMLLGPRVRMYGNNNSVVATCPPTLSNHDRNKCLRDFTKAQEKIRRRYND